MPNVFFRFRSNPDALSFNPKTDRDLVGGSWGNEMLKKKKRFNGYSDSSDRSAHVPENRPFRPTEYNYTRQRASTNEFAIDKQACTRRINIHFDRFWGFSAVRCRERLSYDYVTTMAVRGWATRLRKACCFTFRARRPKKGDYNAINDYKLRTRIRPIHWARRVFNHIPDKISLEVRGGGGVPILSGNVRRAMVFADI